MEKTENTENNQLTNDEMVMELLQLLKQNHMQKEANDTFEICAYVDSLEKKLDAMTQELANMQKQINEMKEDTFFNRIRNHMQEAKDRLQEQCDTIRQKLTEIKEGIKNKAQEIVTEVKSKGRAALAKVSEIFHVKESLISAQVSIKKSQEIADRAIGKIDAFGSGMREAGQKIVNTFRTFADKPEVDYSQKERKFTKTELAKMPWVAQKKLLEAMDLRVNHAIDKVEDLERDVKSTRKMDAPNRHMGKSYAEQEIASPMEMVAEPEHQYGADMFEAYMKERKAEPSKTGIPVKTGKVKGKAR